MSSTQPSPIQFMKGKQVYLRPFEPEDFEVFYHSFHHSEVRRLTGTSQVFTREKIEAWLKNVLMSNDHVFLMIVSKQTHEILGDVEINHMDLVNRSANIRIALYHEKHFGKGYGTEAMRLMADYAFGIRNLHRLSLDVYEYNKRAIRTYEKVGFRKEGVKREALFYNHQYHDVIHMGLLAKDFDRD
ncbi:GNAT family N-acetyltransferase [Hazenella coriacea]|uniref:RimJ/RimL family protein N-acetyltransferase n=1 Tax=Hazenella coriacea TaxID=1179467 RepID=A0A4R3LBK0_9BACL|nr:GNAT family protein [Hazenella coriacea]TCS96600.1 RimJ/RimL family protein N-acetyltransferase [Hazenella coriacea]